MAAAYTPRFLILCAGATLAACTALSPQRPAPFELVEATIPEMQAALADGRVTSRVLVESYLGRIERHEPTLNAAMVINPAALEMADALDAERAAGRVRGPLHGIPIALKDNINTTDMPTTGGALAFEGYTPPYDATLVTRLRAAGAILIAKTTHTELAHWVATDMPAGYSALGGRGVNPYGASLSPGGSSSGIGTAANLWAASVGTETSGSILNPASATLLAAVKPTVGRISRHGIIPITADQDTAGPMARTVTGAALLLGAMEGLDPHDPATNRCEPPPDGDYRPFLDAGALLGARIGVPRAAFVDAAPIPGSDDTASGLDDARRAVLDEAIAILRALGATVIDPADLPSVVATNRADSFLAWPVCYGENGRRGNDSGCSSVFKYGMKRDFNAYLATLGASALVRSLSELRAFNLAHADRGAMRYGQIQLDISDEVELFADHPRYLADRALDVRLGGAEGVDAALERHVLDALLFVGARGAALAARPGYPSVMVPFALVSDETDGDPAPIGITFAGTACSEPRLLALAYAFEQASLRRVPPPLAP
ncbi:MAG: amidase [Xanthomonadaceae bacterium]|nr:amidase [Xanthomonadaceae bacterium]